MRTALGRKLWDIPRLLTNEEQEEERKASWLELFFDLLFVAVIAQVSHVLAHDLSWEGVGKFILLMVPVFWCWIGATTYNDRFARDDVSQRVSTLALMVPVLGMAVSASHAFSDTADTFAWSYVTFRAILIFMWARAGYHNPEIRGMTDRYVIGFSASAVLWAGSTFVGQPEMYYLWIIGLVIDLITPFTTHKQQEKLPNYSKSHMSERYGLFIIIVLGESVVALVIGASDLDELDLTVMLTLVLGLVLAFGMWWLYFGHTSVKRVDDSLWWVVLRVWMHFPLVIGLTAMGAGMLNVIAHGIHDVPDEALWLTCGAMATALFSLGIIRYAVEGQRGGLSVAVYFIGAATALGIAALAPHVDALTLLGLLCLLVYLLVIHRMYIDSAEM